MGVLSFLVRILLLLLLNLVLILLLLVLNATLRSTGRGLSNGLGAGSSGETSQCTGEDVLPELWLGAIGGHAGRSVHTRSWAGLSGENVLGRRCSHVRRRCRRATKE